MGFFTSSHFSVNELTYNPLNKVEIITKRKVWLILLLPSIDPLTIQSQSIQEAIQEIASSWPVLWLITS